MFSMGLLDPNDVQLTKEWYITSKLSKEHIGIAKQETTMDILLKYAPFAAVIPAFSALAFFTTGHHYNESMNDAWNKLLVIAGA